MNIKSILLALITFASIFTASTASASNIKRVNVFLNGNSSEKMITAEVNFSELRNFDDLLGKILGQCTSYMTFTRPLEKADITGMTFISVDHTLPLTDGMKKRSAFLTLKDALSGSSSLRLDFDPALLK